MNHLLVRGDMYACVSLYKLSTKYERQDYAKNGRPNRKNNVHAENKNRVHVLQHLFKPLSILIAVRYFNRWCHKNSMHFRKC